MGKSFDPKIHKNCPVEFIDFNGELLGQTIFSSTFLKKTDFRQDEIILSKLHFVNCTTGRKIHVRNQNNLRV